MLLKFFCYRDTWADINILFFKECQTFKMQVHRKPSTLIKPLNSTGSERIFILTCVFNQNAFANYFNLFPLQKEDSS